MKTEFVEVGNTIRNNILTKVYECKNCKFRTVYEEDKFTHQCKEDDNTKKN